MQKEQNKGIAVKQSLFATDVWVVPLASSRLCISWTDYYQLLTLGYMRWKAMEKKKGLLSNGVPMKTNTHIYGWFFVVIFVRHIRHQERGLSFLFWGSWMNPDWNAAGTHLMRNLDSWRRLEKMCCSERTVVQISVSSDIRAKFKSHGGAGGYVCIGKLLRARSRLFQWRFE